MKDGAKARIVVDPYPDGAWETNGEYRAEGVRPCATVCLAPKGRRDINAVFVGVH